MKLSSSGKKNNIKVLLNRPRMPLTAKVMPARYVNESPTNTCEGYLRIGEMLNMKCYRGQSAYQLKYKRASTHAKNGNMMYSESK